MNRNLPTLPYELIYHRYKIKEYLKFKIYDSMEREIQANSCLDRIVEYAQGHVLFIPLLENHLVTANCVCRLVKGSD